MGWFGLSGKEHGAKGKDVSARLKREAEQWQDMADNADDESDKFEYERAATHAEEDADIFDDGYGRDANYHD